MLLVLSLDKMINKKINTLIYSKTQANVQTRFDFAKQKKTTGFSESIHIYVNLHENTTT
jgi:hypothetical protein